MQNNQSTQDRETELLNAVCRDLAEVNWMFPEGIPMPLSLINANVVKYSWLIERAKTLIAKVRESQPTGRVITDREIEVKHKELAGRIPTTHMRDDIDLVRWAIRESSGYCGPGADEIAVHIGEWAQTQTVSNWDAFDDWYNSRIKTIAEVEAPLKKKIAELEEELQTGDSWRARATEFLNQGGCPICFASDEDGHRNSCPWGQLLKALQDVAPLLGVDPEGCLISLPDTMAGMISSQEDHIESLSDNYSKLSEEREVAIKARDSRIWELEAQVANAPKAVDAWPTLRREIKEKEAKITRQNCHIKQLEVASSERKRRWKSEKNDIRHEYAEEITRLQKERDDLKAQLAIEKCGGVSVASQLMDQIDELGKQLASYEKNSKLFKYEDEQLAATEERLKEVEEERDELERAEKYEWESDSIRDDVWRYAKDGTRGVYFSSRKISVAYDSLGGPGHLPVPASEALRILKSRGQDPFAMSKEEA